MDHRLTLLLTTILIDFEFFEFVQCYSFSWGDSRLCIVEHEKICKESVNKTLCSSTCNDDQFCVHPGVCKCINNSDVMWNGKCVYGGMVSSCGQCKKDQVCNKFGNCECIDSSLILHQSECISVINVSFMDKCTKIPVRKHLTLCGKIQNLRCKHGICLCDNLYYFDKDKQACIEKEKYRTRHNMRGYKAAYGDYCETKENCIDGLICDDIYTCRCPRECKFVESRFSCDCGSVQVELLPPVKIAWAVLTLVSVSFWAIFILCTVKPIYQKWPMPRCMRAEPDYHLSTPVTLEQPFNTRRTQQPYFNTATGVQPQFHDPAPPYNDVVLSVPPEHTQDGGMSPPPSYSECIKHPLSPGWIS